MTEEEEDGVIPHKGLKTTSGLPWLRRIDVRRLAPDCHRLRYLGYSRRLRHHCGLLNHKLLKNATSST